MKPPSNWHCSNRSSATSNTSSVLLSPFRPIAQFAPYTRSRPSGRWYPRSILRPDEDPKIRVGAKGPQETTLSLVVLGRLCRSRHKRSLGDDSSDGAKGKVSLRGAHAEGQPRVPHHDRPIQFQNIMLSQILAGSLWSNDGGVRPPPHRLRRQ